MSPSALLLCEEAVEAADTDTLQTKTTCWRMDRSFRFCILLTLGVMIPVVFMVVPLYLRHHVYGAYHMPVSSTDSRLLEHRVSSVWCEAESIALNTSFNAYLLQERPQFENSTRTYWTTKHFVLREEESEYWGFYLPKGSTLTLEMCARYDGGKVKVFKGKRNIRKCTKKEVEEDGDDEYGEERELSDEDDEYLTSDDEADTPDDDSSYSSSEEDAERACRGSVFNRTLVHTPNCTSTEHWLPKDIVHYRVPASDYYYVLVTNLNNIRLNNSIVTRFTLERLRYDVSGATEVCRNVTECHLPLSFASSQHVVFELPDADEWVTDDGTITCEPRTMLYFPFYLGVPISILFFAFRGSR